MVLLRSDGDSEEPCNERDLPGNVTFRNPPDLPFADHVDRSDTLNRSPRRVKGSEALTCSHSSFDCAVVLFHHVIQVAYRSAATASAQFPRPLSDRWAEQSDV